MFMQAVLGRLVCESDQGGVFGWLAFFFPPSIFLCAFVSTILGLEDKIMTWVCFVPRRPDFLLARWKRATEKHVRHASFKSDHLLI